MSPYLPFAAIPIAVTAAWFSASHWEGSDPARYRTPGVTALEEPVIPAGRQGAGRESADIRVAAFLPHVPPRPAAPAPALVLHSVMTGSGVHLATINGRLVKEGDVVEGYSVSRIAAHGVDLVSAGGTRHLPMRPLHELPPPVAPGVDPLQKRAAGSRDSDELTQSFWATFDSN